MSDAVMVVIRDAEGRFLLGKRGAKKAVGAGHWMPVSGAVEPGETQEQAVVRECREELGVDVEPIEKVGEMDAVGAPYRLHWWRARVVRGTPAVRTDELVELRWVSREELASLSPVFEENRRLLLRLK